MAHANHFIVYALSDPRTGDVRYIGKTVSGMTRVKTHTCPSRMKSGKTHRDAWLRQLLAADMKPRVSILEEHDGPDRLCDSETWWIASGREWGWPLTNHTDGGEGIKGLRHSPETRAKISKALKGNPKIMVPRGPQSPETIAKRVASMKATGWKRSPEQNAAHAAKLRGRKMPEGTRTALLASRIGVKHRPETIEKMKAAAKNKPPMTAECRAKIGAAGLGRKASAETKALMSRRQKERYNSQEDHERASLRAHRGWETRRRNRGIS